MPVNKLNLWVITGLKLIVKLCGDQGLSETNAWSRELQRVQARAKQQERGILDFPTPLLYEY